MSEAAQPAGGGDLSDPLVVDALDPGIRDLVLWMNSLGIPTGDSGDGVTKEPDEFVLGVPHVFAVYEPSQKYIARSHARQLAEILPDREGCQIELSWNPRDGSSVLSVYGYTNEDVPR